MLVLYLLTLALLVLTLGAGSCAKCFGNISGAWFPIDLCFQNTYASKTLAHDPAHDLLIKQASVSKQLRSTSESQKNTPIFSHCQ